MALNNCQNFPNDINRASQENKPKSLMIDGIVVSDRHTDRPSLKIPRLRVRLYIKYNRGLFTQEILLMTVISYILVQ